MDATGWIVIGVYLLGILGLGLWTSRRRKTRSMDGFFTAGRSLPWWLAGTAMLATSFSSDTPLHTTRMIREHGLSGAWFYWGGILGGGVIAFFFARLWRKSSVVTDAELIEQRYSGKPAAVLRGATALFRGTVLELITLSWVTLGMTKIVRTLIELPDAIEIAGIAVPADALVVAALIVVGLAYSVTSGLLAVVFTEMVEFTVAMLGAILLAGVALYKVGGASGLREKLDALAASGANEHLATGSSALDFFPSMAGETFSALTVGVYLGVMWWSSPYVDGSGQRAQRFLSCKNEGHALIAGIWNMAVQWIIRSWPWYIAALVSMVLYPTLADGETAYPRMVVDLLPSIPRAIMVASFFAAFMATFTGLLNLCASYLSNDVYRRFLVKKGSERHYLAASRGLTIGVAVVAGSLALVLPSVLGAFRFKMELMSGLGLVAVLRWFWWRVNATTELAALVTSVAVALTARFIPGLEADTADASALRLLTVVAATALVTIVTALATPPEPREKLVAFFERVRPPRALWGPIAALARPGDRSTITLGTWGQFGLAVAFVFCAMFGLGKVILGEPLLGVGLLAVSAACFYVLWRWVIQGALGDNTVNAPPADTAAQDATSAG